LIPSRLYFQTLFLVPISLPLNCSIKTALTWPLEGADVFQHGKIDSIGDRVALNSGPERFRTPVQGLQVFICPKACGALIWARCS
jgi:hypothetical protein